MSLKQLSNLPEARARPSCGYIRGFRVSDLGLSLTTCLFSRPALHGVGAKPWAPSPELRHLDALICRNKVSQAIGAGTSERSVRRAIPGGAFQR